MVFRVATERQRELREFRFFRRLTELSLAEGYLDPLECFGSSELALLYHSFCRTGDIRVLYFATVSRGTGRSFITDSFGLYFMGKADDTSITIERIDLFFAGCMPKEGELLLYP